MSEQNVKTTLLALPPPPMDIKLKSPIGANFFNDSFIGVN